MSSMFRGFSQMKCKVQCQLLSGRIRLTRNKSQIQLKQTRKVVADLLRTNKEENARIRVEYVIRLERTLQAYEVLELFVELLKVRAELIEKSKEMPPDMIEAISSLVYATQRITDLPELQEIRKMLGSKYGKEYVAEASSDALCRKWHVNENLIRCLDIGAPAPEDKLACLSEIAQEHGVEWDVAAAATEMLPARRALLGGTSYSQPLPPGPQHPGPPPAGGGDGGFGGNHGTGGGFGGGGGGFGNGGGFGGGGALEAEQGEPGSGPPHLASRGSGPL